MKLVPSSRLPLLALLLAHFNASAMAEEPLTFKDAQGNTIVFPFGIASFADRVVAVDRGTSPATDPEALEPEGVLGVPDYGSKDSATDFTYLSLGKNGSVTVEFTDNYLVDVEGPDLWIFEIGPFVESTRIEISKDGVDWIDIGVVEGSTSGIDIGPFVEPGEKFTHVRVIDNDNPAGQHAGADIDAIGAIGSIARSETDEQTKPMVPKKDGESGGGPCYSLLRIEMKDGSVQIIDLSEVKSIVPITGN
jgi:OOP family OmpA-OmpF porin